MAVAAVAPEQAEHFNVLIVGAGISGVGSAYHLKTQCPDKSYVVLEKFDSFGGTWHWHKYPGIRSDSDLHTFGYRFKPWTSAPIATAEEILTYMNEVIDENDLGQHIRYNHEITRAEWNSEQKLWHLTAKDKTAGVERHFTCNFLWMCQGYYKFEEGYTPEWDGMDDFKGQIVHPQTWPEDIDLKDKKIVCIGSGATTATVVPAIAGEAEHVTVLQRSPTFFIPGRNENELAEHLRKLEVPEEWVHEITRKEILFNQAEITQRSFEEPDALREELLEGVKAFLGPDYDINKHFNPSYRPWQQRIAFVPDGDLFQGITSGKASMVTDQIERFEEKGVRTKSGELLEADIIITATGFNLSMMGGIPFFKDGEPVNFADTVTYRGMMFTGVPNMLWVMGYFRASWTLRTDMLGDFVCRLLKHMDEKGVDVVEPKLRAEDEGCEQLPWLDEDNFNPGYMKRGMHIMPKRLDKPEWMHTQDYWVEKDLFPQIDLDAEEFKYS